VTVDELVTIIDIALGSKSLEGCEACDANRDRHITIDEAVLAVGYAVNECSQAGDDDPLGSAPSRDDDASIPASSSSRRRSPLDPPAMNKTVVGEDP
jgi:hypothetical protein